jgi:intracellular septation protein A
VKLLFDLFPVILFFLSFKISEAKIDQTMGIVNRLLGSGIDPMQAPVILATSVAIVASILQVAFVLLRGKKVEVILWLPHDLAPQSAFHQVEAYDPLLGLCLDPDLRQHDRKELHS